MDKTRTRKERDDYFWSQRAAGKTQAQAGRATELQFEDANARSLAKMEQRAVVPLTDEQAEGVWQSLIENHVVHEQRPPEVRFEQDWSTILGGGRSEQTWPWLA